MRSFLQTGLLGTAALFGASAPAWGQHHHHHGGHVHVYPGHGHHHHDGYYGGYNYQPIYAQPYYPQTYYPQPYVQQPYVQQPYPQYAQSNPLPANPLPTNPLPAVQGPPIALTLPAETGGSMRYTLNGQPYSIGAGQSQTLTGDRQWTIAFDRGTGAAARYTLSPGFNYKFVTGPQGWNVVSTRADATAVGYNP